MMQRYTYSHGLAIFFNIHELQSIPTN